MLVGGVVVEDHVDHLARRHRPFDRVQEAQELLVAMTRHAAADDRAVEHVEGGEQRGRAVALVVVGHRAGLARLERQARLGAVERLDLMGGWPPRGSSCQAGGCRTAPRGSHPHGDYNDRPRPGQAGLPGPRVDEAGQAVMKRRLRRAQIITYFTSLPPCLVGMEACATAHFWARELRSLGHEVRLMPPQYVKAYVKRGKNDAADAAAICEAVTRPSMRFVPVKTKSSSRH